MEWAWDARARDLECQQPSTMPRAALGYADRIRSVSGAFTVAFGNSLSVNYPEIRLTPMLFNVVIAFCIALADLSPILMESPFFPI